MDQLCSPISIPSHVILRARRVRAAHKYQPPIFLIAQLMPIQRIHKAHPFEQLIQSALSRHLGAAKSGAVTAVINSCNDVELNGTVTTWYQKQLAQESMLCLPEVRSVKNSINVVSEPDLQLS